MTFLSDLLYVDIDTSGKEGLNITYRVWMQDAFPGATRRNIYVGQLYARGGVQRIYLNDIVNSYLYNNSYAYLNGAELDYGNRRKKCFDAKCPDEGRVCIHGEEVD